MAHPLREPGPFRADQVPEGSRYELSNGHPVYRAPAGPPHARANSLGVLPLATDPACQDTCVDTGYSAHPGMLRAPDITVGPLVEAPGKTWTQLAPPLAVEYDMGHDEADLQNKIRELLAAGTKFVWVVRLKGLRRVEVHTSDQPMKTLTQGQDLRAPGVLQNPVRVEALWDREAAMDAALRNLLQSRGYGSVDEIRDQGRDEGMALLLAQQVERKLGRSLTADDHKSLRQKLSGVGPARLGDAVLDLAGDELARWLADPEAR